MQVRHWEASLERLRAHGVITAILDKHHGIEAHRLVEVAHADQDHSLHETALVLERHVVHAVLGGRADALAGGVHAQEVRRVNVGQHALRAFFRALTQAVFPQLPVRAQLLVAQRFVASGHTGASPTRQRQQRSCSLGPPRRWLELRQPWRPPCWTGKQERGRVSQRTRLRLDKTATGRVVLTR